MHALGDVMVWCAVFAAVGAAIGFVFIHRRDLHESARSDAADTTAPVAA
ncbi:hypothetical protein KCH_70860 [Kitasatospora cheerisanensis KCTC 2395]|uniref:Uncharacterized protein n=1 Tax=Kitasatospora cheerisanensis KCTC 2395 TaxID=1348663 RepID=A0A066YIK2_9ACTN|nr:hypothetical protein KCH_70860 [Kitasatospora cheerisanensis KCTC 2395]